MSSEQTNIMTGVKAGMAAAAPGYTISDTYKDFTLWGDTALLPGIFTIIPAGEPSADENRYYLDITLVGQQFIPKATLEDEANGTPGAQINEIEGAMKDIVKLFALGFEGQVTLGACKQSMQLDSPYCWIAYDMRVGPFRIQRSSAALQPLTEIDITIEATNPDGSEAEVDVVVQPEQPT